MRYDDWPERLSEYIISVQDKQFEYGVFDCCTLAAGAVEAITGVDYMEEFRDTYDDEESSKACRLEQTGTVSLYRILRRKFGPPVHGAKGQIGDVAFFEGNCGVMLGRYALFIHELGPALVRISLIDRAFKVN